MEIHVKKDENEIVTKFINAEGKEYDFDYVELIDLLIENEVPKLIIDDVVEEKDKKQIQEMYTKICSQVKFEEGKSDEKSRIIQSNN